MFGLYENHVVAVLFQGGERMTGEDMEKNVY